MGQQRHEKQFKDKLGQREIQPSAESWDKLRMKLDGEEKRPRPVFWWIGIAATLVGGLLIAGMIFFNNWEITPVIVDVPGNETVPEKNASEDFLKEEIASEETEPSEINSGKTSEENERSNITPIQDMRETSIKAENIAEENKEMGEVPGTIPEFPGDRIISQKLEEIIAETSIQDNEEALSSEIEALLHKAVEEISLEKKNTRISSSINPQDLLYDVEMELEQSFREKVFDVLKEGYLKARTAVANRNVQ